MLPLGFQFAGVHCGIKRNPQKEDFTLIHCPKGAVAAGVYTQNLVFAAPVALDRERTPSPNIRVVAVNSGNANACTGERGLKDAYEMARLAASAVGADEKQALVMSTGIIGVFLPMEKIAAGANAAAAQLGSDEDSAQVTVHVYDASGKLADSDSWQRGNIAAVKIVPKKTGTYLIVFSVEQSNAKKNRWALAYGFK